LNGLIAACHSKPVFPCPAQGRVNTATLARMAIRQAESRDSMPFDSAPARVEMLETAS
jgi:hypothetical protein